MRRLAVLLPIAALACRSVPALAPGSAPSGATSPAPVVVTFVIDQFAAWIAADRLALLPEDGGFARLRREGTWALDMRYAHPITETSPGHAALYTGVVPRQNGIYSNDLPGPDDEALAIVKDPRTRLIAVTGPTDRDGASLHRLRADTLADRLRRERPRAAIVSLSLKDRGALYGGGKHPDATLWFDHTHDVFVTSTAVAEQYPDWARPLTDAAAIAARRSVAWTPLDPAFLAAHAKTADDAPGEGDYAGLGTTFPHDFVHTAKPGPTLRASPQSDALLLDLALAAIDADRRPGEPMLVALSLSAHDYVGHVFGPDSWEAWDELERLDASLAQFFHGLDERLGAKGWALLLTADHGTSPMPELPVVSRPWCAPGATDRWQRACGDGGRVDKKRLVADLRAAASAAVGEGSWVAGLEDPFVFLTAEGRALDPGRRQALRSALTAQLTATPGVARVLDLETLSRSPCAADESIEVLVCNAAVIEDGASLYAVLAPGWSFYTTLTPGKGGNHGSPYVFDRAVPLLARAPGRIAAGAVLEEPISFSSFSRTAAALLGIRAPAGEAGVDLTRR
jgi:predicted AlkP superfamily pyrophosphatase or phosphodiesterase